MDSGKSWYYPYESLYYQYVTGLDMIDSIRGFAVGFGSTFFKTSNGGLSWDQTIITNASYYLNDVGFMDSANGWVAADNGVFQTIDGGSTWTKVTLSANTAYKKISILRDDKIVFAFGTDASLLKLDLTTDVDEPSENLPQKFNLYQNYPNPFNPMTIINYQLPYDNYVTIKVYNILGEEVATLVYGMQDAGYKSVEYDASSLSSGVYFYRMLARPADGGQAESYTNVMKFIVMK